MTNNNDTDNSDDSDDDRPVDHAVDLDLDADDPNDIEAAINQCDRLLDYAEDRAVNGRYRDKETERLRLQWVKAISSMLRTKRQYLNDRELADMADDLAELERELEREGGGGGRR